MAPRSVPYLIVDAFTDRPFGGNPAGVVHDASGLSEAEMRGIAREINLSETAFLLPPSRSDCRYRVRFLTPSSEVPLCGHATVAAYASLAAAGALPVGARFLHETGAGALSVEVRAGDGGAPLVFLEGEPFSFAPAPIGPGTVAAALGIPVESLSRKLPVAVVGGKRLVVPLADLPALDAVAPDFRALLDLSREHGWQGIGAVVPESRVAGAFCTARYFAPAVGVPEDPVTGTLNAALGGYFGHLGLVPFRDGTARFTSAQGEQVGRPGLLRVEADGAPGAVERTRVGGAARVVARGEFLL